jgi:predicted Zn-dependent protease
MVRVWSRRSRHYLIVGLLSLLLTGPMSAQNLPLPASPMPPAVVKSTALPPAQTHPLPPILANWQDQSGDYFEQVQRTPPEYLIWSQFPVKVYVEPAPPQDDRAAVWVKAMHQAVQEWTVYLPLTAIESAESADITIRRSPLALRTKPGEPLRARSAETRFELYAQPMPKGATLLAHRVVVVVRPNQTKDYLVAAARHEIGHALGIWGHSPLQTDSLYFSQVRTPPPISPRDVNTLKRIYQQSTRLGWPIP